MIRFNSFNDAIEYNEHCVVCKSNLYVDYRDLAMIQESGFYKYQFYLSDSEEDLITINSNTDDIEISLTQRPINISNYGQSSSVYTSSPTNYNGTHYHRLTFACEKCCQYSYTIQLVIDLHNSKLDGVFLNSETVSLEDEDGFHEIKNRYSSQTTEYFHHFNNSDSPAISFPLISSDLFNPTETLKRVKKLILFT